MRQPTLPALKRKAWKLLSEYVRRSAADGGWGEIVGCYTCGHLMPWKDAQAGHFVGGRSGAVLLNPELIRVQCVRCNIMLGGNYQAFTLKMIDEVGREKVEYLLSLKHKVVKWNRQELESFISDYKGRLANLSKGVQF